MDHILSQTVDTCNNSGKKYPVILESTILTFHWEYFCIILCKLTVNCDWLAGVTWLHLNTHHLRKLRVEVPCNELRSKVVSTF